MGKKKTINMDESQEQELDQRSTNKYKKQDAFDLPEEYAELAALYAREAAADKGEDQDTKKKATTTVRKKKVRSKKFLRLKKQVDRKQKFNIADAIKQVQNLSKAGFKESIELHVVSKKDNVSGKVTLPHGIGKEKKVAIFDAKILKQIEEQKIEFDVLIAKPEDMAKLAKHARFLGPRGLMPNPKKGTINTDPTKVVDQFGGGNIQYKTEKKAPLIHFMIGKAEFKPKQLEENIMAIMKELNPKTLVKASICSTMGPGVKLDLDSINIAK